MDKNDLINRYIYNSNIIHRCLRNDDDISPKYKFAIKDNEKICRQLRHQFNFSDDDICNLLMKGGVNE